MSAPEDGLFTEGYDRHRLTVARIEAEGIRAERDAAVTELATAAAELCRVATQWVRVQVMPRASRPPDGSGW